MADPSYKDYQPIPDDNQAAAPIGAPEGDYKGDWVNLTFRHMMSVIRILGDASLQVVGTTYDAMSRKIVNLAAPTLRTDAVNLGAIQDGTGVWAGTSTGTANVQTFTPSPAVTAYVDGMLFRGVAGFTNTGPMTLGINGVSAVPVRDPIGQALTGGEWLADRRVIVEYADNVFRLLNPNGWMDQTLYDQLYPVNRAIKIRADSLDENNYLPRGVAATWTRETTQVDGKDPYLRISSTSLLDAGGSLKTVSNKTGQSPDGPLFVSAQGSGEAAKANHDDHPIPQLDFEPTYVRYALWRRTV